MSGIFDKYVDSLSTYTGYGPNRRSSSGGLNASSDNKVYPSAMLNPTFDNPTGIVSMHTDTTPNIRTQISWTRERRGSESSVKSSSSDMS